MPIESTGRQMSEPIDITLRLRPEIPTWPGSVGFRLKPTARIDSGSDTNVSALEMDVHCGTHLEGPLHFLDRGAPVESIPLDALIGPASVVHLPAADQIGPDELEANIPSRRVQRLLLRTRNSDRWESADRFRTDYVALTTEGARWIADRKMRLVGIDYLSVQIFGGDPETHRVLMRAGVAILEGLDLSRAPSGDYRLTCLPLRVADAEAAPARAILEPLE
jgi:arylformamidase